MTDNAVRPAQRSRLSLATKLFYGCGSIAFTVKDSGFSALLLLFYNQVIGLGAPQVGLAIMIAMVVDAVLDPMIGQISDHWRSAWGRRHPLMYMSAVPAAIGYIVLWNPPDWSQGALFFYLLCVAVFVRISISFFEVASSALIAELTSDYDERTELIKYRTFFSSVGSATLYIFVFAYLLVPDATHPIGQLNPAGYVDYGLVAGSLIFASIMASAIATHRHIPDLRPPPAERPRFRRMIVEMYETISNRSFVSLCVAGVLAAMAAGMGASLSQYFLAFFWEFSTKDISMFMSSYYFAAFIALYAAVPFSRRLGKRRAWRWSAVASVLVGIGPLLLRLAGLMPENHTTSLFVVIFAQTLITLAFAIMSVTFFSSMMADVVEDNELRTGRRSEGLLFSVSIFLNKAVSGLGIFASSVLLGLIGFPSGGQQGPIDPEMIRRLALVYAPTALCLYGLAIWAVRGYRITRTSHEKTLKDLGSTSESVAS